MRLVRAGTLAALAALAAACDTVQPVEPTAEVGGCERCHGYPPPPFIMGGTSHTASTDCSSCHPGTVEPDNVTIVPGGLHMNGVVDATGAAHALPFTGHPAAALAGIAACTSCHGADYGGGAAQSCNACHATRVAASGPDWKANCTFCHGTRTANVTTATPKAAPPEAVVGGGDQTPTNPKVGAHQAHLNTGTYRNALPCSTCHAVPSGAQALTHFSGGGAILTFDALASTGVTGPSYAGAGGGCTIYCHGSGTAWPTGSVAANPTPSWTSTGLACNACHGIPPLTGRHDYHVNQRGVPCSTCHAGYTSASVDKALHVDGVKDVIVVNPSNQRVRISGWDCTTCHGTLGV
jgi:predicted CxxxxCH...CXXCH cytochrome family protein